MHPDGYARHVRELHRLARWVFDELRAEFPVADTLPVRLDHVERLTGTTIEEEHAVAALVCAQLLFRATRMPEEAQPRHVVALCDITDQALINLMEESDNVGALPIVRHAHERICTLGMNLAFLADPGAPDFTGWPE